jgi:hypothetical protein
MKPDGTFLKFGPLSVSLSTQEFGGFQPVVLVGLTPPSVFRAEARQVGRSYAWGDASIPLHWLYVTIVASE